MNTGFTYEQASEICEDFEDLVDTDLRISSNDELIDCVIEHVVMVPYAEEDKYAFMQLYKQSGNPAEALQAYKGDVYDVLIIAHNLKNNADIITQTIGDYISSNGVRYNFPEA